jgi:hypothetical protein
LRVNYLREIKFIAAPVVLAVILFIALLAYAPDAVPFSTNNYGWNGLQQVSSQYSLHPIGSFNDLQSTNRSVLLIDGPVSSFTPGQASAALDFVKSGGTLVVADSSGSSNSLLGLMHAGIKIESGLAVYDNVYNWKAPSLPNSLVLPAASGAFPTTFAQVSGIALNDPSPLLLNGSAIPAAETSPSSVETNRSSAPNPNAVASGPFTVAAIEKIGAGNLLTVGDSEFLTNSMIGLAGNRVLVSNLFANSTVYLDTSHWPLNTVGSLKADLLQAYSAMTGSYLRYLFTLLIIGAVIGIRPFYDILRQSETEPGYVKDLTIPEKDPKILERIRKERS